MRGFNFLKSFGSEVDCIVPRRGKEAPAFLITNERRAQAFFVIDERVREAPLDAKELAVVTVNITVARNDAHNFAAARADRELTAVGAERAGRSRALKLPRARLMPVSRVEQSARRADLDAVA